MELVDVFCVNEVEASALAGAETFEADVVLRLLHQKYPQPRLLLTAGSGGSYYLDAEQRLFSGGPLQRQHGGAGHAACHKSSRNRRAAQRRGCIHPGDQRTEMRD